MESSVRLLDEHAIVLRAHVSPHGTGEHLDGGLVDVFWPKRERRAQGGLLDVLKGQQRGLRGVVEGHAELALSARVQGPLAQRARCVIWPPPPPPSKLISCHAHRKAE
jgi:hypothetical protein